MKLLKFLKTEVGNSSHQLISQFKFYFNFCISYFLLLIVQLLVQEGTLLCKLLPESTREDRLANERTPNTE